MVVLEYAALVVRARKFGARVGPPGDQQLLRSVLKHTCRTKRTSVAPNTVQFIFASTHPSAHPPTHTHAHAHTHAHVHAQHTYTHVTHTTQTTHTHTHTHSKHTHTHSNTHNTSTHTHVESYLFILYIIALRRLPILTVSTFSKKLVQAHS